MLLVPLATSVCSFFSFFFFFFLFSFFFFLFSFFFFLFSFFFFLFSFFFSFLFFPFLSFLLSFPFLSYLVALSHCPFPIAPEVLETLDTGDGYKEEVDLWGLGVILYILLCGFPPFYGDDDDEIYDKICEGYFEYPSPYWDHISDDGFCFVLFCFLFFVFCFLFFCFCFCFGFEIA